MKEQHLEGEPITPTLDQIEAQRAAGYAVIAADYYAKRSTFMQAVHAREDVDRAADKAREAIVNAVLAQRRIAA